MEALDLIDNIARPDDRNIAPCRVPDPRFWQLRSQLSPSRFAVVVMPPLVPDPTKDPVRPKQPMFSQRTIAGSHFCFCSPDPSK
jgi:hypothetical protein